MEAKADESEAKADGAEAKAYGREAENVLEGAGYVYRLAAFEARGTEIIEAFDRPPIM